MLDEIIRMFDRSKYTVHHDPYDEYVYRDISDYEGIRELEFEDFPTLQELLFDTFNLFYKMEPRFIDDDKIRPEYRVNKTILKKAVNTEEYDRLRTTTKLDEMNSAVATVYFVRTVISELIKRDFKRKFENIKETMDNMVKTASKMDQLGQQMQSADPKTRKKLENQMNSLNQQIQQLQQMLNAQVNSLSDSIGQTIVSKAVEEASKAAREYREAERAVMTWGTTPGSLVRLPASERLKVANLLMKNRKLRELAKMLGKMKNVFTSTKKSKIRRPVSEIYDVTIGSDVDKAIPVELAKLHVPELKLDFLKRFAEGQLMTYKLRDKQKVGKGDFVVCVDISGSMQGQKEVWAKAVALACLDHSLKQKRRFAVVMFDSKVQYAETFTKPPSIEDIVEIAETFTGGGTNFERPLTVASEIISEGLKKADILFITDGECSVSEEFLNNFRKFKDKTKTRVISVFVEGYSERTLEKFSDKVINVRDFVEDTAKVFVNY